MAGSRPESTAAGHRGGWQVTHVDWDRRVTTRADNLSIRLRDGVTVEELKRRLDDVPTDAEDGVFPVTDDAVDSLKFSACLPRELAVRTLRARGSDRDAVRTCLHEPMRQITLA